MWHHPHIQAGHEMREHFWLLGTTSHLLLASSSVAHHLAIAIAIADSAPFFLNHCRRFADAEEPYAPTDEDMVRVRVKTTGKPRFSGSLLRHRVSPVF